MSDRTNLIDDDGENRAVRSFLALFQSGVGTVGTMARSMAAMGWADEPAWVRGADSEPLTKAGAQFWIRHLLALEAAQPAPDSKVCRDDGRCQYAIDSGAEGMGACPVGKCVMPPDDARDATRYRWLRDNVVPEYVRPTSGEFFSDIGMKWQIKPTLISLTCVGTDVTFDRAVDIAMQQEQKS